MTTQSQNAAAILRAIRDRLNLTQEALAEKLQVSFATVWPRSKVQNLLKKRTKIIVNLSFGFEVPGGSRDK